MDDPKRDPRLAPFVTSDNDVFSPDPAAESSGGAGDKSELQEIRTAMERLSQLVSASLAGRTPVGEVLVADPANLFPRPLMHRSLELSGASWAPLVPLDGVLLYQSIVARSGFSKSLGSVIHVLPFLYSMLSFAHDALHNLRVCQTQIQDGSVSEEAFEASLSLLDKVIRLGGKRYTEIQVMVDHDVPTASLLHLQNFGPAGAASLLDAGDRALLVDIRKQEMKEQKKQVLQAKPKQAGGKKKKFGNSGNPAPIGPAKQAGPRP